MIPGVEIAGKIIQKTLCLSLLFFVFSSQVLVEAAPLEVEWKGCLLNVKAEGVPLSSILKEVSRKTGLGVRGSEYLKEPVTIHFSNLTLSKGLKRLLANMNHILLEESTPDGDSLPTLLLVVGSNGTRPMDITFSDKDNDLQSPDPNTRLSRIQELLRTNPDHIENILYVATQDPDPSIRQLAYKHLYERGDKRVADILLNDARNKDSDIRKSAILSLGELSGSDAVEILRDATSDENIDIRYTAFQQLSQMASNEGLSAIRARLNHPDPEIRIMAIEAMASNGEEFALEAAMSTLHDSDELVRSKAEGLIHELEAKERR